MWRGRTIRIWHNSSIIPTGAPICIEKTPSRTYCFLSDDIITDEDGIVVEKDHVAIDGKRHIVIGSLQHAGIVLEDSTVAVVTNMRIKNFDLGISLDNSSESKIVRSIIVSNTTGIQLNRSNYFELVSNIVKNSHTYSFGLRVRFIEAGNSVAIIPIAIRLNKVRNTKITFNNLKENNFIGTFLSHSNGNRVIGNEIWENGYGMCLHFSSENEVFRNNFIRNKKQVFCRNSVNVWNSTRKVVIYHTPVHLGNYWSDYTGHDENDDGVGDVPYVIDKENKDEFPSIDSFTMGIPLDSE